MKRPDHVVSEAVLDWQEHTWGEHYGLRVQRLAQVAGGQKIGCTLYEVPPGKRPCPYHYHTANEEAILVLAGSGTLRLAGEEVPLRGGHYVALPVGESGAHQVVNDSGEPLRYLAFSTMIEPEVAVYPDSDRVGVLAGQPPGGDVRKMTLFGQFRREDAVPYWEGEEAGDE
jgi:uncharacterized cupin superfamily protein